MEKLLAPCRHSVKIPGGMDALFRWIESTPLSVLTRESTSVFGYPAILSAHAIGMALAAGISVTVALHLLGFAPGIPTRELKRYVGILWGGFWLNAVSGVILLIAYPTKALTNPVFYLKIALIAVAMGIFVILDRRLWRSAAPSEAWAAGTGKVLAGISLVCWGGAIVAGRLLAYTYRRLMVDF
jgi:hypothetical protein